MGQPTSPAPPEVISTKGLVLRRPRLSDANDIFDNYAADPEVTRYVTWRPYTDRSEVAPFLQSRLARWDSGEEFSWAITRAEEDRVIGMIGCRVREHAADIGYVMSRNYWNRGYITEAAKAVVDWAGNLEFIYRVWAVCDVENRLPRASSKKWGCNGRELFGAISFIRTCRPSRGTALYIPRFVENLSIPFEADKNKCLSSGLVSVHD